MNAESLPLKVRRLAQRGWAALPFGADRHCCLCHRRVRRFLPYRDGWPDQPVVLKALAVVGSDIDNFECPACGCHDRERHLLLYLTSAGILQGLVGKRILHIAPEGRLRGVIAKCRPLEYVLGDLHPAAPGIRRIDLLAIDSPDGHFDLVMANHVLEHVSDDQRALREIWRVLRPGGLAILQTPYASALPTTLEEPHIVSPTDRLQAYGQEDHIRLYGADFPARVAAMGFGCRVAQHSDLLPDVDARRSGVNAQEPLMLFVKPEPT